MIRSLAKQLVASKQTDSLETSLWELRWLLQKLLPRSSPHSLSLDHDYNYLPETAHSLRAANRTRLDILTQAATHLSPHQHRKLAAWVHQRSILHKPLQYILGTQPFVGLDLLVRKPTLIPRWETEEWCVKVSERILEHQRVEAARHDPIRILDLCSGSGCIALGLASLIPHSKVVGVDVDRRAVLLSRLNARRCGLEDRVEFCELDLLKYSPTRGFDGGVEARRNELRTMVCEAFGGTKGTVHYVVSNPPYIPAVEYKQLEECVKGWEDKKALQGLRDDGSGFYAVIAEVAAEMLDPHGKGERVFLEIGGKEQAGSVERELRRCGFSATEVWNDLAGKERVVVGGFS
ncbi:hypothetical protein HDU98_011118 [Podochytrium sp. JEL0797]|nr:hypothetical protein HDU98_011118 [Podochytrium sp. JEL0797]